MFINEKSTEINFSQTYLIGRRCSLELKEILIFNKRIVLETRFPVLAPSRNFLPKHISTVFVKLFKCFCSFFLICQEVTSSAGLVSAWNSTEDHQV